MKIFDDWLKTQPEKFDPVLQPKDVGLNFEKWALEASWENNEQAINMRSHPV